MHTQAQYPFVPKSTSSLVPGQFWALPLSDGSFGCGRVVQLMPREMMVHVSRPGRRSGLAFRRTADAQIHCACAMCHSRPCPSESNNGNRGLNSGSRALDADGIQPWLFRGAHGWQNSNVQLGFIPVRPQQPEDRDLPVFSTWGFDIAASIADARFVQRTGPWANKRV